MTLSQVLATRYDASIVGADPLAVLWAADALVAAGMPLDDVRAELRAANRKRERAGRVPAYAPYGSLLWKRG